MRPKQRVFGIQLGNIHIKYQRKCKEQRNSVTFSNSLLKHSYTFIYFTL